MSLHSCAHDVLQLYPHPMRLGKRIALGNRGGFSGASLWRVETGVGTFCLRAWPEGQMTMERLKVIHRLMEKARKVGLSIIPALIPTLNGGTWIEHLGRLWELTDWMSGSADFHSRPTSERLESACTVLARLHLAWAEETTQLGLCPAVRRRLNVYHDWQKLCASGWRPQPSFPDPVGSAALRAWEQLQRWINQVPQWLQKLGDRSVALQPCLCDIWHDHVFFQGDVVTGLIDFGSVKLDHVSVDLARLLGSLVEDGPMRETGLQAYERIRPLEVDETWILILDWTGTLLGMANWLKWLYLDGRSFEDREVVARRLKRLVARVEKWKCEETVWVPKA